MQVRRTVRDLRRDNRSVLLSRLYRGGPQSRQDLGRTTALSQASVSNVVGELIDEGLVEEAGRVESDGGRPRMLLRVGRTPTSSAWTSARPGPRSSCSTCRWPRWPPPTSAAVGPARPGRVVAHILDGLAEVRAGRVDHRRHARRGRGRVRRGRAGTRGRPRADARLGGVPLARCCGPARTSRSTSTTGRRRSARPRCGSAPAGAPSTR